MSYDENIFSSVIANYSRAANLKEIQLGKPASILFYTLASYRRPKIEVLQVLVFFHKIDYLK